MKRTELRSRSKRKEKEIRDSRPVVDAVFERDEWACVLRTRTDVAGECFGHLTPHHILKQSRKQGLWVPENLVSACSSHNDWVELNRPAAEALGLVVREEWELRQAWRLMRAAGLAVGVLRMPCKGPQITPLHRREIDAGEAACEACGHFQLIVMHPDGGPGPVLADHEVQW